MAKTSCAPLALLALATAVWSVAAPVSAQTVYRSIQDDGVTSFSDTPPEARKAEKIVIDTPKPSNDASLEERLATMRETTERMAEDRRERERHRAELKALRTPAVEREPQPPVVAQPAYTYWPVARPPLWRPHPSPRIRPTPRPQTPPGWSVLKPGNAQLMRPVVSRRPFRR
ncbi:MAG: DUF4124 domain-containing protein [Halieaceae bacterium]|jgi:hypothetical protein|nr:DUF4124 domain-containing protein [Halieaceae bacterium]